MLPLCCIHTLGVMRGLKFPPPRPPLSGGAGGGGAPPVVPMGGGAGGGGDLHTHTPGTAIVRHAHAAEGHAHSRPRISTAVPY